MRAVDLILKKRNGNKLNKEEIDFMVSGYTNGDIPDYQMSAFLMAIYFEGMDDEEAALLTDSMLHSGEILDLSSISGIKVDKHSTGGVGDKTSLVVAPIVASLGIKVAKMSGRGLGHTGGTIDKLESIPGYNTSISIDEFISQVEEIGISIIGQTKNLAPADKKLYALRDVTGTVESIPLIASSIMSKKLASGADAIVLDVKVGSGAFMKDLESARHLARLMVEIGKTAGKKVVAILTNMDEPLGYAVGNNLEVIEAINTLNGKGPKDFTELCLIASAELIVAANLASDIDEGVKLAKKQIDNKKALDKFADLVRAQGGDESYIYHPDKFAKASNIIEVKSTKAGYVVSIDALQIGNAAMQLGAGRKSLDDKINHRVGVVLNKKVGDKVEEGDTLAYIHSVSKENDDIYNIINKAINIDDLKVENKLIYDIIK